MATVDLIGLNKSVDGHVILDHIDLRIEKGEFVAVVGPSGCGKSTLLRLIAGLDEPTGGSILINHQCMNGVPPAKRDIAMVFQHYALYPHMTVFDNMAYGLKMRGVKQSEILQRVAAVATMLHLSELLKRKPSMLSGGQRQRVAMGRAIVRAPAVFLFDEPLSNLDATLRTKMRHEIKKMHSQLKTTCLYVTHDQTEAMTMADKMVVLNNGKIEQEGRPRDIYQYPATLFVAGFIGQYPMNLIEGTIDKGAQFVNTAHGVSLPVPKGKRSLLDGEKVLVGIRPEHLYAVEKPSKRSFSVKVEFIDDLGADKLLQVVTVLNGSPLLIRVLSDKALPSYPLEVEMDLTKATLFGQQSGERLGGWNGA